MGVNIAPSLAGSLQREFVANGAVTQYAVVVLSTPTGDGLDSRVKLPAAVTDQVIGIAQHAAADGEPVRVCLQGESYVVANGAFSVGDPLSLAATTGKVDTAASGNVIIGIAREAANATNDLIVCSLSAGFASVKP
jgi:hypothetical protein